MKAFEGSGKTKTNLLKQLVSRLGMAPYKGSKTLILAVSGGMDSMVLLDVFLRTRQLHGAELRVCHIHHGTGDFADRALELVRKSCGEQGLPLLEYHYRHQAGNFEYEAARFRRQCLLEACGKGEKALMAHHQRDQAETLLMALVRGAGANSALGMDEERGPILRPFLDLAHADLLDHAHCQGLNWLEDPMNQDEQLFRNQIRLRVLPLMRGFHQACEARMAGWLRDHQRINRALAEDAASRFEQAWQRPELQRACLDQAPAYLRDFILALFWKGLGLEKPKRRESERLSAWLEAGKSGRFEHGGGRVYLDADQLVFLPKPESEEKAIRIGEDLNWGPWRFRLREVKGDFAEKPLFFTSAVPMPKQLKEFLRINQVPARIREHLFALRGSQTWDLLQLHHAHLEGLIHLEQIEGPCLFSRFFGNQNQIHPVFFRGQAESSGFPHSHELEYPDGLKAGGIEL